LDTRHSAGLDAEGLDYLARMSSAARRMQALLRGLLAYSRVTTRAMPFEPINLVEVVERVVGDMDLQIEELQAEVVVGDIPVIEADVIQMYQLFQNLLSNALKFQPEGNHPQVEIHGRSIQSANPGTHEDIPLCAITVRDNGIGFDEKYRDRIFQPFQRLHGRDDYPGTGMGLAICRKIVERHDGTISATSTPGAGTTFTIQLPVRHTEREA
jgi:signal transduction histidine kinase